MKLSDLSEKAAKKEGKPGTYAGVRFSPATTESLEKYTEDNKIPKPIGKEHFHTTLLYSRKHLPNYEPAGEYEVPMKGTPTEFEVWPSQPDEKGKIKNCLVLKYSCPTLYQRHHKLMLQHGATYDFDEYKPHITISYDIGKFDADKLPEYDGNIEIIEEYKEDLQDSGWADDKTKEKSE